MYKNKQNRIPQDAYQTPFYTIESLLNVLDLEHINSFTEPCKGNGNIYNSIPIDNKYFCEIKEGKDYLIEKMPKVDLIITNPPFIKAEEFLRKSLIEAKSVIFLLRINFLESKRRQQLWSDIGEPNKLLPLAARPSFAFGGTDGQAYAWFCWDNNNVINLPNGIHVLPYLKY